MSLEGRINKLEQHRGALTVPVADVDLLPGETFEAAYERQYGHPAPEGILLVCIPAPLMGESS